MRLPSRETGGADHPSFGRDTEEDTMHPSESIRASFSLIAAGALAIVLVATGQATAGDPGLQVEVDPKTGAYSMPKPGTLIAPAAVRDADSNEAEIVVTPGASAAGGFKVMQPGMVLMQSGESRAPAPARGKE
jgi:hypothetical protein